VPTKPVVYSPEKEVSSILNSRRTWEDEDEVEEDVEEDIEEWEVNDSTATFVPHAGLILTVPMRPTLIGANSFDMIVADFWSCCGRVDETRLL
jgi:hypothetical protein